MTTHPAQQKYTVDIFAHGCGPHRLENVIDWKLEGDLYFFFQEHPGQVRPRITTQWLRDPQLIRVVITPVGTSVPFAPPPNTQGPS